MKKVAIYIRVSTEEQVINGNGIDIQRDALISYAKVQGYNLDDKHIFTDEGKSGAQKKDRPALYNLFQSAKNKEFEVVLVWKIDRFFRKNAYLLEGIEALNKLGVGFVSMTQNIDTTNVTGKLTLSILGGIAEMERDTIRERTMCGILVSMKKGKWGRGNCPYGYRKDKDKFLVINEDEAQIIRMIFNMINKEGLNINQIGEKLNNMNIETSGSKGSLGEGRKKNIKHKNLWQRSIIHKILRNEIYTGILTQNKFTVDKITNKRVEKPQEEWIIGKSPVIVSKKEFQKVKISLEKNLKFSKKNTTKGETYMLARLLQCGVTGYKYIGYKASKGTKNYRLSVNKTKVKNFENIGQRGISALKIETVVWSKLKEVLQNPNILQKELHKMSLSGKNIEKEIKEKITLMDNRLLQLDDNSKGLLKMVTSMDDESIKMIQAEIVANNNQKEGIRKEKELLTHELKTNGDIQSQVSNFIDVANIVNQNLDNLSYETKAEICKLMIEKVVFDGSNAEINLIVPISPNNKKSITVDVVKDFFNESKEFMTQQVSSIKSDVVTGLDMISNLRTYYYHG